jgi:hypothetical protein
MQMRTRTLSLSLAAALLIASTPGRADVVTDWNATALAAAAPLAPYPEGRVMSIAHGAMFDAANAIARSYKSYLVQPDAPAGASIDAAVAGAAHDALVGLLPGSKAMLDAALAASLAKVGDAAARDSGLAIGRQVAERYLADRANDGSNVKPDFTPGATPGQWRPTSPGNTPFGAIIWADVKPWAVKPSEVPAPGPLSIDSPAYQRDLDEVRRLGGRNSTERTADQTAAALFTMVKGGPLWSAAAKAAIAAKGGGSVIDNARAFALMHFAQLDAFIAGVSIKRQYALWRPITAIRSAATNADPTWEPLLETPPHPDYVSTHCVNGGAIAEVLRRVLKTDGAPFTAWTGHAGGGFWRSFANFSAVETEIANGRVWAGIHTRTADEHGAQVGHRIGELIVQRVATQVNTASN